ncbi:hypothetical protein BIY23_01915 [Wolbachia pipientis]|uniref:Uncharacterized protein n=1 Tax=Wolbachia pipientis TaxID=955 RepID=A0A1E7QJX6_WOLPI|nr:hypothetical protein [Wolbachia pipientis]OEY86771.1 hypothetical protein BIY23_01915 [Wolbachia pipientis]
MAEDKKGNSFVNRFIKKKTESDSAEHGAGRFANKCASGNTKANILGSKDKISQLAAQIPGTPEAFAESGGIKSKSRMLNDRSFADQTRRSRSDLVFLVRGKDRDKAAWHYVLVDKDKKEMFLAKSRTGSMDVADYGEILYSGWGEFPSRDIKNKINAEFGGGGSDSEYDEDKYDDEDDDEDDDDDDDDDD